MPDYSPREFTLRKLTREQLNNPMLHLSVTGNQLDNLYKRFNGKTKVIVTSMSRLSPYALSDNVNMNLVSFYFKEDAKANPNVDVRRLSYIASDIVLDKLILNDNEVI